MVLYALINEQKKPIFLAPLFSIYKSGNTSF